MKRFLVIAAIVFAGNVLTLAQGSNANSPSTRTRTVAPKPSPTPKTASKSTETQASAQRCACGWKVNSHAHRCAEAVSYAEDCE